MNAVGMEAAAPVAASLIFDEALALALAVGVALGVGVGLGVAASVEGAALGAASAGTASGVAAVVEVTVSVDVEVGSFDEPQAASAKASEAATAKREIIEGFLSGTNRRVPLSRRARGASAII
ncbi:MAG TPA: hypothetical protein VIC34_04745 [Croceibacterium sp.]